MKRIGIFMALLVLVLALAVGYAWRRSYGDSDHERFQAGVWRLRHLDATFNEDLLRARFSLLESYDDFERYLHEMECLTADLHAAPRFVDVAGRGAIARSAEKFGTLLQERRALFERFKSRNAVLANSRRYFPVAVNELAGRLGETDVERELNRIIQQVTGALLANAASADELRADALGGLERMRTWAALHPAHPEAGFVSSLVRHAQQLLVGKSELDALTRQLLTLPTVAGVEQLSHLYEQELAGALHRTQQYRMLLYGLGGLLVAVAAYAFWAQRDANRGLEARVEERTRQLRAEVEERKRAAAELALMHRQLLDTSRRAGMAEVATGVLHNVGNVLNSVNVSATLVVDQVHASKTANLPRLGEMLRAHTADLADYLTNDPKGRRIPGYVIALAGEVAAERKVVTEELGHLRKNIEHIKDIVAMQQSYAKVSGVLEAVAVAELVEDALRMNASALVRHGLEVVRDYEPGLVVTVERHKVLQVLVNLIRNAKHACDDSGRPDKKLVVRIARAEARIRVSVIDNGVGIPAENLTRIFVHGFTTKKDGHGFGLHSGALVARELGGALTAHSDGPGRGAAFVFELPFKPESNS